MYKCKCLETSVGFLTIHPSTIVEVSLCKISLFFLKIVLLKCESKDLDCAKIGTLYTVTP